MLGFALFALASSAGPATAPASPAAKDQSAAPVSQATAAELARTVAPADMMVSVGMDQAQKAIALMPSLNPDAKALESDYPGIWAAAWEAVAPELRKQTEASLPEYWEGLEKLYRARLTEDETAAIIRFYHTPTGRKLINGMAANFDGSAMFADMIKSESGRISSQQLNAAANAAKMKTVEQLTADDATDLMELVEHVKVEKFRQLGAETQKITFAWVNKEDPEGDAAIEKVMMATVERYMKDHPAKK